MRRGAALSHALYGVLLHLYTGRRARGGVARQSLVEARRNGWAMGGRRCRLLRLRLGARHAEATLGRAPAEVK